MERNEERWRRWQEHLRLQLAVAAGAMAERNDPAERTQGAVRVRE